VVTEVVDWIWSRLQLCALIVNLDQVEFCFKQKSLGSCKLIWLKTSHRGVIQIDNELFQIVHEYGRVFTGLLIGLHWPDLHLHLLSNCRWQSYIHCIHGRLKFLIRHLLLIVVLLVNLVSIFWVGLFIISLFNSLVVIIVLSNTTAVTFIVTGKRPHSFGLRLVQFCGGLGPVCLSFSLVHILRQGGIVTLADMILTLHVLLCSRCFCSRLSIK